MTDLRQERADLVERLYEIEGEALDTWSDDAMANLRHERDEINGRINAIDVALVSDDCAPTGEP